MKIKSVKIFISENQVRIASWLIILIVIWTNFQLKFWNNKDKLLIWDVKAYYVYLPAVFIYHDMSLSFLYDHRENIDDTMFFPKNDKGMNYIQTTYGLALVYSPFFLITHGIMKITGGDATGYSPPYRFALVVSSVFYLALGIYFLRKFLLIYFSKLVTVITLVAIVLGTNLYYYTTYEAPMSHAYNFALIAAFIYFTELWYRKNTFGNSIIIGFLLGLISLIRPVNLLILIFFILYGVTSWKTFQDRIIFLFKSIKWIILMMVIFFLVWLPQFLYWKYISGSYLYYSYNDLGFFFNNPQIASSLISYRKGLFVYIPVMLLAFIAIPLLYKRYRGLILPVGIFTVCNVYILSSWCFWWFGGGFGPRSYIDSYAIMAIPFAALASRISVKKLPFIITFIIILLTLVWFNFFQTKQYYNGAIHWVAMTKESYWDSFLKLNPTKTFTKKLLYPNYELAKQGIYYKEDFTTDELDSLEMIRLPANIDKEKYKKDKYIENLGNYIRSQEKWMEEIEIKARERGITVDSMIVKDATWLYEHEKQREQDTINLGNNSDPE